MNSSTFKARRLFANYFTTNRKLFYFLFVSLLLATSPVFSQAPLAIPYQAVARTSSGNLIINQLISVRFSVHDGTVSGAVVYQEKHSPTTNALGLFSVNIGGGTILSGTMAGINWGSGAKFLQVEFDPAGGSSYIDMGTTQMMSVPYALHARTAEQNGGKTYLILSGAITDAQAAAIVAQNVGPNTQFVKIINTANLTTVNLSGITELVSLTIENNSSLTTVNLGNLNTVYEDVLVSGNQELASVDLGALTTTGANSNIIIQGNPALASVDLGSLTTWQSPASPGLLVTGTEVLTTLDLGSLTSIGNGALLTVDGSFNLSTLNLDNLKSVYGTMFLATNSFNCVPLSINLNALDTIIGEVRIVGDGITSINAGSLKYILGTFSAIELPVLTSVDMDALTFASGTFDIFNVYSLTLLKLGQLTTVENTFRVGSSTAMNLVSLDLGSLSSISGYFQVTNQNLTTLDLGGLTSIADGSTIYLGQCGFTSSVVNTLLASFASALPFTSVNIDLTTFSGTESPTGQGVSDKNTIISNGNTVNTD